MSKDALENKKVMCDSIAYDVMEYSKMLRMGKYCGLNFIEIYSIIVKDTLKKRFILLDSVEMFKKDFSFKDLELCAKKVDATILKTPIKRSVMLSSSQIGFMSILQITNAIVGIADKKYVVDSLLISSNIKEVGNGNSLSLESLLLLNPDLIMTFATGSSFDDYNRLESLNIPLMLTSEWQENSPLGKFEWIKLYGKLFNVFVDSIYEQSKKMYLDLSLENNKAPFLKPRVLAGMSYGGVWYAPGGNSYTAKLIQDAGGKYLWESDSSREMKLSLETVMLLADSVDVWINPGNFKTLKEIYVAEPRVSSIKAFKEKQVFQNDGIKGVNGSNDFYEGAVVRPAELLENLKECINLGTNSCKTNYKWYRNIYN